MSSLNKINIYLSELAKTKPGRIIFTSSEGYETSMESARWNGHGVFTYCLLEGLKGKADQDRNAIVTLGEIIDYVDISVRRETKNAQHPSRTGARFDRSLPMSILK